MRILENRNFANQGHLLSNFTDFVVMENMIMSPYLRGKYYNNDQFVFNLSPVPQKKNP